MNPQTPLLEVRDLRLEYATSRGPLRAVDGISFDVAEGEALGIIGESGSGKTSLALTLMRLLPRNATLLGGSMHLAGEDVGSLTDEDFRQRVRWSRMAMVFQGAMHSLNPVIRVGDQVGERLKADGLGKQQVEARVDELLGRVGLPAGIGRRYPHELSGGMKQRVMIATALTHDPPLLILDEPTSALDVSIQAQIMNLLKELKAERRISMLFITHDLALASDLCDHIAVVYAGQLREHGSAEEVLSGPARPLHARPPGEHPQPPRRAATALPARRPARPSRRVPGLSIRTALSAGLRRLPDRGARAALPLPATRVTRPAACCWTRPCGRHCRDRRAPMPRPDVPPPREPRRDPRPADEPLLRIERLSVRFFVRTSFFATRPIAAVSDVDLDIATGETVALVGESGSGKTTLGRATLHLVPISSGRIVFEGTDIGALDGPELRAFRQRAQVIFQDPFSSLSPYMRVGEIVEEPLVIHGPRSRDERESAHPGRPGAGQAVAGRGVRRDVPPHALGWTAAAGQHRAGHGAGSGLPRG